MQYLTREARSDSIGAFILAIKGNRGTLGKQHSKCNGFGMLLQQCIPLHRPPCPLSGNTFLIHLGFLHQWSAYIIVYIQFSLPKISLIHPIAFLEFMDGMGSTLYTWFNKAYSTFFSTFKFLDHFNQSTVWRLLSAFVRVSDGSCFQWKVSANPTYCVTEGYSHLQWTLEISSLRLDWSSLSHQGPRSFWHVNSPSSKRVRFYLSYNIATQTTGTGSMLYSSQREGTKRAHQLLWRIFSRSCI